MTKTEMAQTKISNLDLMLSENISSYNVISYMFCLCCFAFPACLNIKWTKFSPSSSLYICRDLFYFCPVAVVVDRCRCMYIHIFLGCLVFGYFEAHTSDGHSSINWMLWGGREKESEGKIIFMCTCHLHRPPSRTIFFSQNSLKFSAATLKQYMNEKDRSVSNNDDVVHVLDKSKASAMYESGGGSKFRRCGMGKRRDDDDSPTLNIVLYSYEWE